jgi:glucose-6-phosphate isomerase
VCDLIGNVSEWLLDGYNFQVYAQQIEDAEELPLHDPLVPFFLDNTDPDGTDRVLARLSGHLHETLVLVISKSGSTPETRNGMLETARAFQSAGLELARHAVAVTGKDSQLERKARAEGWLSIFPMWDWVGGRTSITSPVGLLPAALQGIDIHDFLEGARLMDVSTRSTNMYDNPAALLSAMWYHAGEGRGTKAMVVIPYKDRLLLFGRYLQQLVMESLGKELDLQGRPVNQGIVVYGNKGSTDQHAYVQQLREELLMLDPLWREILVLRDVEGLSYEEIARVEGVPVGTIRSRLNRGRRTLQELFFRRR